MSSRFIRTISVVALVIGVFVSSGAVSSAETAPPLSITIYNPGMKSIFPVSSEIITGPRDAILIDAQFQTNDASNLVTLIRNTGKHLQTIYISHSDPDYYFGLAVLHHAFPDAKILATPETVAAIRVLKDRKLRYWSPIIGKYAPKTLIVPDVLHADHLLLDGHRIIIEGLNGPTPARSYVYIPSLRTVAGGAVVFSGTHVWVADTQTVQARKDWRSTLHSITALQPVRVIPGHYLGTLPEGVGAVLFTDEYLVRFDEALSRSTTSSALIAAMEAAYPDLAETTWLKLGAKVIKGDMVWPQ